MRRVNSRVSMNVTTPRPTIRQRRSEVEPEGRAWTARPVLSAMERPGAPHEAFAARSTPPGAGYSTRLSDVANGQERPCGGWLAVSLLDGAFGDGVLPRRRFSEVVERFGDAAAIAVDFPIGLPHSGVRPADKMARRILARARASVFPVPPRAVPEAPT